MGRRKERQIMNHTYELLNREFKIDTKVLDLCEAAEAEVSKEFKKLDDIMAYNQYKVLDAFQKNRLSDMHFRWNTGYGYDDPGRDAIERVYADIFHTDKALVPHIIITNRAQIAIRQVLTNGTGMNRPFRF